VVSNFSHPQNSKFGDGAMARPRKPTAALELKGAFKKDPQRKAERKDEPKPSGAVGHAPAFFVVDEKLIWDDLAGFGSG
jgi:hypothetical protein